jgi:hypothetical protein
MVSELGDRSAEAELLDRLRQRLERAAGLEHDMRASLKRADVAGIETATSRLETVALEVRLVAAELDRLPRTSGAPDVERARVELDRTATRLARSAAVGGGLLHRLVGMTRRFTAALDADTEPYLSSGAVRERALHGLRLEEKA